MKKCRFCAEEIMQDAKFCKHCRKRQGTHPFTAFVAIGLGVAFVLVIAGTNDVKRPSSMPAPDIAAQQSDEVAQFIATWGPPQIEDSTERDSPRPPIPTRRLVYSNRHVRVTFLADTTYGSEPPYHWKLVGFQDPTTNRVITTEEFVKRMGRR